MEYWNDGIMGKTKNTKEKEYNGGKTNDRDKEENCSVFLTFPQC